MSTANVRFRNAHLELFEAYVSLDDPPPEWLSLSELDGFLTGLAIGPEEVPVDEWMPHVFGGEMPASDNEPAARIIAPVIIWWAAIPGEIDSRAFRPILREGAGGSLSGAEWAEGFAR